MAAKKTGKKKSLPTWVSVVVIVVVLAGVIVFYASRQRGDVDYHKVDPGAAQYEQDFYEKCKDINFFKEKVNPMLYKGLVDKKIIPPEWAEGNYVPYYDPSKK